MKHDAHAPISDIETTAELRELYRAAEARAARLRLLSSCGSDLSAADSAGLEDVLNRCTNRLALFLGRRSARIILGNSEEEGFVVAAPGNRERVLARICVNGVASAEAISDPEDQDACLMLLDMLGTAIDRMERERELHRVLSLVQEREARLEHLVGQILSAQEEERRRVAYELHDGVAQTATALVRMLEGAGATTSSAIDPGERAKFTAIARGLVKELRSVIAGLRPTVLDDLGLIPAIEALADALESDGYEVKRSFSTEPVRPPPHIETALYRVAQEAITNIRKHAGGACSVSIVADLRNDAECRFLRIADDGRGLSENNEARRKTGGGHHIGIEGMRERLAIIGGVLIWQPRSAGGVLVEARLAAE